MLIVNNEAERLRRQRLALVVAKDIDGGGDGESEGDEDVGTFGRVEWDTFVILRGVVVLVQMDVFADIGAFA